MKENIYNTSTSPKETRSVFVGAKVTPSQRDHIKSLAEQCGMTVSDYILSCAYNFKPKARLTKEEAALLQNLDNCRSDLVKYTSALHGMSTKQRMVMFNQIPFMVGWLGELSNVAEGVCQFLEAVKEKNRIPSNPQSEEKSLQKPKPYLTVSMTFVILLANQNTRSIRKKYIGYWTISCLRNWTLWEYGTPCS